MLADIPASRPRGFLDINSAVSRLDAQVNLMGVVTDFLPPGQSRGKDLISSFSIADPSYGGTYDDGLKVRFFRPLASEMPAIKGIGDVVLLRGVKIKEFSGMTIGLSTRGTSWVVFPAGSIPEKAPPSAGLQLRNFKEARGLTPTSAEMHYAIGLCNSRDRTTFTVPSSSPTATAVATASSNTPPTSQWRDKFSLLKDVNIDTFYNFVGQVVRLYPGNGCVELYFTDYTRHPLVWNYPEPDRNGSDREGEEYNYVAGNSANKKWNGPYGQMTLTVTLWGNNASFGRQDLKENDLVHLRNVHIKFSRDNKVEGALHEDRRFPDRIDVTVLKNNEDDDRVKDVLRRKRDYWRKSSSRLEGATHQTNALKRKSIEDVNTLSKSQARKKRRLENRKADKLKDLGEGDDQSDKENEVEEDTCRHSRQKQKRDRRSSPQRQELNNNVRCAYHLKAPRPVSSIISLDKHTNTPPSGAPYVLPFQNINSRATVRVIDFFPPNLVDFAVRRSKASEYDILSDDECSESDRPSDDPPNDESEDDTQQWEWRFRLVLEDAQGSQRHRQESATIEVYVAGHDAEGLLKLEAEDLRKSPVALDTLREKLFLLWGDLEERKARGEVTLRQRDGNPASPGKDQASKMKPFQCCIKEYGVKKRIRRTYDRNAGETEDESGSEREDRNNWVWERRWRMFGCTIT